METTITKNNEMSTVEALWTLYRQQSKKVQQMFLARAWQENSDNETLFDMPCLRSREEMVAVSKRRMRSIVEGREKTLSHKEVMKMVDEAIAEA